MKNTPNPNRKREGKPIPHHSIIPTGAASSPDYCGTPNDPEKARYYGFASSTNGGFECLYIPGEGWIPCKEIVQQFAEASRDFWFKRAMRIMLNGELTPRPNLQAVGAKPSHRGFASVSKIKEPPTACPSAA